MLNPPPDLPIEVTPDGHWLWTGRLNPKGYGWHGRKSAHRVVWVLCGGVLEEGKMLCHKDEICPHRNCVNPEHIYQGTHQQNVADAIKKGSFTGPRKVTDKDIALVNYLLHTTDMSKNKIAKVIGVTRQWMPAFLKGELKYAKPIAAPE